MNSVWKVGAFGLLVGAMVAGQTAKPAKVTGSLPVKVKPLVPPKPECAKEAICFSGAVSGDSEFRWQISPDLDFVLRPAWTITVVPHRAGMGCETYDDFSEIATTPLMAHNNRFIDESYGWTAEQEVERTPREFYFVTNCQDDEIEGDRYRKGDLEKFGTSPLGHGRLWITNSRVSHAHDTDDDKSGEIESMEFSVEVVLPTPK
jgi:hypothetical protein